MEPESTPHAPPPSLWPVGFAVGIVCVLVGLVIGSWSAVAVGAALLLVFGFLWIRDVTTGVRAAPGPADAHPGGPETATDAPAVPATAGGPALPLMDEEEVARFPRSRFLEAATLGLGGVIGGIVTLPVLGFAVAPAFLNQETDEVDIGPLSAFPEGQFVVATFMADPDVGEVSRRTAYVRNNGLLDGKPSFTIVSNRCAHLGCPVQANGLLLEEKKEEVRERGQVQVELTPVSATSGFGCPCHGGQYDNEGNVTAGPPVRALDRFDFAIRDGRLFLRGTYSVSKVVGEGAEARIKRYRLANPGDHVDGPEAWLYPVQPPSG